jgi:hypothetical protein
MNPRHVAQTAVLALTLMGSTWAPPTLAAPLYSKQQCLLLFTQLNHSGTGQLSVSEAAADPTVERAFQDPGIRRKGFLTERAFTDLCMSTDRPILDMPRAEFAGP